MGKVFFFIFSFLILSAFKLEKNNDKPTYVLKGLYLDSSFLSILGNSIKEDSLLKWSKANNFNKFSYYHMGKILASEMKMPLASFIEKAKANGIIDHTAIMGGDSTFFLIKQYNNSQSLKSKFTSIQIEDEWWQVENTVEDFYEVVNLLKKMKAWGESQKPDISVELYFGRFNNIPKTEAKAVETLIKYSDKVIIAHQFDDPVHHIYPNYLKHRVKKFHLAAKKADKEYPVIIIFYPGQAPLYYSKNSYQAVFNNFNNSTHLEPNTIIDGYQIFAYTEAIK